MVNMKKYYSILIAMLILFSASAFAQKKWKDLTQEEKTMKLEEFIQDNHKYMQDSLGLSDEQVTDVDAVNICYLSTLDRITRYVKTDADKEKYAKVVTDARTKQLEAIMGASNFKKFRAYVEAKVKKAGAKL